MLNRTHQPTALGQSLWLDNITREILDNGTLRGFIDDAAVTGLTSNPTIFDRAIANTGAYDEDIREKARAGKVGEALFLELALEDLRRAADLFRPVFEPTDGVDGWVSMEVSPLLAGDTAGSTEAAKRIHEQADPTESLREDSGHAGGSSPRSRRRSSRACRSTSRCSSRASSTWPRPRPICAASSAASPPASSRASRRSLRCS